MLNAKEKAIELYNKFWDVYQHDPVAQECALICVNELIEFIFCTSNSDEEDSEIVYLEEVKIQIYLL